jgi:hypothetical protein
MSTIERIIVLFFTLLLVCLYICHGMSYQSAWDDSSRTKIYADNILEKINKGEDINYGPDFIIVGDLILDRIINKSIKGNIYINSDIYGRVIARNMEFHGLINFGKSNFYDEVSFEGSVFLGKVIFDGAVFKNKVSFEDANFADLASFEGATYEKSTKYRNACFNGSVIFSNTLLNGLSDFSGAVFYKSGEFQYATFKGRALFNGASFKETISLLGSELAKDVEFYEASFEDDAVFDSIRCESTMHFNDDPSFRLDGAKFNCQLSFRDATVKCIDLNNSYFSNECQIFFNNCDFNELNARWDDIHDHMPFNKDVYFKFINYYRSVGLFDDANACYREYYQNLKSPDFLSSIRNFFFQITSNYGTNAAYPLIILLILLFLFAFLYWIAKSIKRKDNSDINEVVSFRDCLYFSATVLINYSNDYIAIGKWRWLAYFEFLLGWLMLLIFAVMSSSE